MVKTSCCSALTRVKDLGVSQHPCRESSVQPSLCLGKEREVLLPRYLCSLI